MAVKQVVAEDQRFLHTSQKSFTNQKSISQSIRAWLLCVLQLQPPALTAPQQLPEMRQILRCRNNQNITDTRQHQGAQRVIDHWLVIHWQQLLAHRVRDRMQPGSITTSKNDAAAIGGTDAHDSAIAPRALNTRRMVLNKINTSSQNDALRK